MNTATTEIYKVQCFKGDTHIKTVGNCHNEDGSLALIDAITKNNLFGLKEECDRFIIVHYNKRH